MSGKPPPADRNEGGSASAEAVRSILVRAVAAIATRLGEIERPRIATEDLCRELTTALSRASWPGPGFRVRRDRIRGETGLGGAWRFDVLIERSDGVVAVIDVRGHERDPGLRAETLSRLSLARARGVAETAFLFGANRSDAIPDGPPAIETSEPGVVPTSSLAIAEIEGPVLSGWVLTLWEVPASVPPSPRHAGA